MSWICNMRPEPHPRNLGPRHLIRTAVGVSCSDGPDVKQFGRSDRLHSHRMKWNGRSFSVANTQPSNTYFFGAAPGLDSARPSPFQPAASTRLKSRARCVCHRTMSAESTEGVSLTSKGLAATDRDQWPPPGSPSWADPPDRFGCRRPGSHGFEDARPAWGGFCTGSLHGAGRQGAKASSPEQTPWNGPRTLEGTGENRHFHAVSKGGEESGALGGSMMLAMGTISA